MPTNQDDDRVLELLELWEELRHAGKDPSTETLCAGCVDLAGELRQRIRVVERVNALLADREPGGGLRATSAPDVNECGDFSAVRVLVPAVTSFRDLRLRARGGLGEVFEGFDESLQRSVAIKLLRRRCARSPVSRRRFEKEAQITGRLEHPGIAPVYALGHAPDGRPYYAMQFIRGETLQDAIDRFHSGKTRTIARAQRSFARSGATRSTDFRRWSERAWSTAWSASFVPRPTPGSIPSLAGCFDMNGIWARNLLMSRLN